MPLQREHSRSPLPQGEGLGVRARRRDIAKPVLLTPDKLFRTLLRESRNPSLAIARARRMNSCLRRDDPLRIQHRSVPPESIHQIKIDHQKTYPEMFHVEQTTAGLVNPEHRKTYTS